MPGFFDGLRDGISDRAQEAVIRSKEAMDSQHVKSAIDDLEEAKAKAIAALGQDAHTMLVAKALDQAALAAKSSAIVDIDTQIANKQKELEDLHTSADAQVAEAKND
ncbi:MAG: hypothetical protein Q7O66_13640 [Dehalococcoidia bacterium]|nr:hypothetical protein [Dehalococcoidia bacterium]